MLRIGKLTDYALLIVNELAKEPHSILSAAALADILHLAPTTVSKILKMLAECNLVNATRGVDGGYRLARDADQISIADIVIAMEGDLAITECCELNHACMVTSVCTMQANWKKINKSVYSLLNKISIIDMSKPLVVLPVVEGLENGK
jgi:FeS assembly SUF system regulator